jgi:hypothetical protein
VDLQRRIATTDFQSTAHRQPCQGAIDQQMRAAIEAEILKVDSRVR